MVNTVTALAVAVGAVLGAWLRWALSLWLNTADRVMPWGTLVANVAGGLMIGLAVAWFARHPQIDPAWRLFALTGFLGALTTFSTFSIESLGMLQRGAFGLALVHSGLHLFGSLAAAAIGYRLAS
ncbi:MAG: fluoride efflux transporter CrcB [Burkholderiaceae bacterium]|nr:fluoride efflux transporter CrcB [Burkholderiaceae bacterium]